LFEKNLLGTISKDYTRYGSLFYILYPAESPSTQNSLQVRCNNEGGQLAAVDSAERVYEVNQLLHKTGQFYEIRIEYYNNLLL